MGSLAGDRRPGSKERPPEKRHRDRGTSVVVSDTKEGCRMNPESSRSYVDRVIQLTPADVLRLRGFGIKESPGVGMDTASAGSGSTSTAPRNFCARSWGKGWDCGWQDGYCYANAQQREYYRCQRRKWLAAAFVGVFAAGVLTALLVLGCGL